MRYCSILYHKAVERVVSRLSHVYDAAYRWTNWVASLLDRATDGIDFLVAIVTVMTCQLRGSISRMWTLQQLPKSQHVAIPTHAATHVVTHVKPHRFASKENLCCAKGPRSEENGTFSVDMK